MHQFSLLSVLSQEPEPKGIGMVHTGFEGILKPP